MSTKTAAPATPKQLGFIEKLAKQQKADTFTALLVAHGAAEYPQITAKVASAVIDALLNAGQDGDTVTPVPKTTHTAKPATPKQVAFIEKLQAERGLPVGVADGLSAKDASAAIDGLLALPKAANGGQIDLAAPVAPAPVAAPASALVGKLLYIPYADSAAVVRITADDGEFVTLVKSHGTNPDDWTHPLIGNGPTRIEKTAWIEQAAKDPA